MNTGRLYIIAEALLAENRKQKIGETLKAIIASLQNQINQPQNAQFQQQVSENYKNIRSNLTAATSNNFSPSWKLAMEELKIGRLFGLELLEQISEIFQRNQITPSIALENLNKLDASLSQTLESLEKVVASFNHLKVPKEDLKPGECEVGILVPREFVDNRLGNFGKELTELNKILMVFSEIATGNRDGYSIRSISSSELSVYLNAMPEIAVIVVVAIDKILDIYKKILDIKGKRNELKELGVPDTILTGMDSHAKNMMDERIELVTKETFASLPRKIDAGRRNELETEFRVSLNKIANRIDRGFNVEVRVREVKAAEGKELSAAEQAKSQSIANIQNLAQNLTFIRIGGAPILHLPESDPSPKAKADKPAD